MISLNKKNFLIIFPLFLIVGIFIIQQVKAQDATLNTRIKISVCGNFVMEGGEQCDNYDFGSQSCASLGYDPGSLNCNPDCSLNVSACPPKTIVEPPPSSGGGGGGGGAFLPPPVAETSINFFGRSYPNAKVILLKDAQIISTTSSSQDAFFSFKISNLTAGNYMFSVYSETITGHRSPLLSFPVRVTSGTITTIDDIFISPTVDIDNSEVQWGEDVSVFGYSAPQSTVKITVHSGKPHLFEAQVDEDGVYSHSFNTKILEVGDHLVKTQAILNGELSGYGKSLPFTVLDSPNYQEPTKKRTIKADLDIDTRVNLVDYSILAYWYKRADHPAHVDLNEDGKIDLIDFSIMAFYWTG